jgi:hypothetical protein
MSILDARMTLGAWQPTGQLRDDRIEAVDANGQLKRINWLVHKSCLADFHNSGRSSG